MTGSDERSRRPTQEEVRDLVQRASRRLDGLTQGRPRLELVHPGAGDVARQAEQAGTRRLGGPGGGVRRPSFEDDARDVDQGLDVVDDGRTAEQPGDGRERRLLAWLTPIPLDRGEQRRLLSADVCPLAAADLDVERLAGAHHVSAQEPGAIRLGDGVSQPGVSQGILAPDVDVSDRKSTRLNSSHVRISYA